jgi:mannose-6-phosphate isomerase-like protein (cupin superfamily)
MKFALLISSLLGLSSLALGADGSPYKPATVVKADAVTAGFEKGGTLVNGGEFQVQTSRRVKPGGPEAHMNQDEIMYVVSGSATLVTGGTITGLREGKGGNVGGTGVEGGVEQKIGKGDVVVVPKGTPHWFKEVPETINYYVVKVNHPN